MDIIYEFNLKMDLQICKVGTEDIPLCSIGVGQGLAASYEYDGDADIKIQL
jgi:hypothetical protein